MEINTVVISLDRLKELEAAEALVNKPKANLTIIKKGFHGHSYKVETDDECVNIIAEDLAESYVLIRDLEDSADIKAGELDDEIEKLKEMSLWRFFNWRRE